MTSRISSLSVIPKEWSLVAVRDIEKSLKGKVKNKTPFTLQETCFYNLRLVFTQKT